MIILVKCFWTDSISHLNVYLLYLILLAVLSRKPARVGISGSQGIIDRRGLQSGSDGQERASSK